MKNEIDIPITIWDQMDPVAREKFLQRSLTSLSEITNRVRDIVNAVRCEGDAAIGSFSRDFDNYTGPIVLKMSELNTQAGRCSTELRIALEKSAANIQKYHAQQQPPDGTMEVVPGVVCSWRWTPINDIGLYVPGGGNPLSSTALMLGIPAKIAGCRNVSMCTPPDEEGTISPSLAQAALIAGVNKVYLVGGAQAVAGMAFGTESMRRVDKIFGPGNDYVNQAKLLVSTRADGCSIDLPAGPSEVVVVAGPEMSAAITALDLLAQLEHGPTSQAMLIAPDENLAANIVRSIKEIMPRMARSEVLAKSLKNLKCTVTSSVDDTVAIINLYAPEHLIAYSGGDDFLRKIVNASCVFYGPYSAEAAGDYASGPNHVLPTGGFARSRSGLTLTDYMKRQSIQTISKVGLSTLSKSVYPMAKEEGLDIHAATVRSRLEEACIP